VAAIPATVGAASACPEAVTVTSATSAQTSHNGRRMGYLLMFPSTVSPFPVRHCPMWASMSQIPVVAAQLTHHTPRRARRASKPRSTRPQLCGSLTCQVTGLTSGDIQAARDRHSGIGVRGAAFAPVGRSARTHQSASATSDSAVSAGNASASAGNASGRQNDDH